MTPENSHLTGKILLAHPNLHDPNFRRSIVYLAKHDPLTGAFGFIINRPTTQTFEALDMGVVSPLFADITLYLGGPVSGDSVLFVMLDWDAFTKKLRVHYTTNPEEVDPAHSLALVGYAGWSAGQLEQEIAEDAWFILDPADTEGQLLEADTATWKTLVARIHPHLKLLAEMPDNPGLN